MLLLFAVTHSTNIQATSSSATPSVCLVPKPQVFNPLSGASVSDQPANMPLMSLRVTGQKLTEKEVRGEVCQLKRKFSSLVTTSRVALGKKVEENPEFLEEFRDALLLLPVPLSEKPLHDKFFQGKRADELFAAKNINQIFVILSRYWNYTNYGLLKSIVESFCDSCLTEDVEQYCVTLDAFERATTIDVFLVATSASETMAHKFITMAAKINKSAAECTLHDVRKLKNSLAEESGITAYSIYVEVSGIGSVRLTLGIHPAAVSLVASALTQSFLLRSHMTDIVIDGRPLHQTDPIYLVQPVACMMYI